MLIGSKNRQDRDQWIMKIGRIILQGGTFDIPHINFEYSVKVLGITFFNDTLHMQNHNWKEMLTKLEKVLNLWKVRRLSLKGKSLVVNTLALSKIWYLGTIIKPLKWATKQIKSLVFKFIWDGSTEQVSRDTLYLPVEMGGLGILEPWRQMQALDLKDFKYIIHKECDYLWVYLARYWIGRRIGTLHLDWRFLSHNNSKPHCTDVRMDSRVHPFFYEDFVDIIPKDVSVFNESPLYTKNIYLFLQNEHYSKKYPHSNQTIFQMKGPDQWNRETTLTIPWKQGWQMSYQGYNSYIIQDCTWKLRHHIHMTNFRLHTKFKNLAKRYSSNTLCGICNQVETALHAFANCSVANRIWRYFWPFLIKILPSNTPIKQPLIILGIFENKGKAKNDFPYRLAFTITSTIVDCLWKKRQQFKSNHVPIRYHETLQCICSILVNLLNHKYKIHKANSTVKEFKLRFAINNAICSVNHDGDLIHHLSTN